MEHSIEREKVIKGLEICVDRVPGTYRCNECPYEVDGNYCEINLTKDTISLLKEQEAEIRQLRFALDIAKETYKGIKSYGGKFTNMPTMQSAT